MAELLENVAERYIKASNEGRVTISDELLILEHLVKSFNLVTQSEYAREENITPAGVNKRIKEGKLATIKISSVNFILKSIIY